MSDESYPVHEKVEVIDGEDIFKNDDWWKAVVVCESWGNTDVNIYLWQRNDGEWNRKQKYKAGNEGEWRQTRSVVDDMFSEHFD